MTPSEQQQQKQQQKQQQTEQNHSPEQRPPMTKSVVATEDPGAADVTAEDQKRAAACNGSKPHGVSDDVPSADTQRESERDIKSASPLDEVLHVEPPRKAAKQHPAMSPPPYVHHFDTWSLVNQLQDGGFTKGQAIEAMKGVRGLLAQNLSVAQDSLVSKSDVENESYLFRAACSELGQEIRNNRRLQDEQIRQQRTHLQHEVDILTQSLNQEASTLNDNVRGMFNDRKMAVREEQKNAESAVQQINYKISTSLGSDSKSEIEGVRWILIRRSAMGIFFMAMLTLATVRYATYVSNERNKEAHRRKEEQQLLRREAGKRDHTSAADAAAILAAN
ncbi:moz represents a chromatin-associated acetyltransferase [Emericellopsis cladophorae]|uniref:Moz represents a chromatin-associated acetyltransferase n=1 Tax=Emericellopsis cladophorae TaxID=2686198 RepID=A0A9P9Y6E2_9HYPO|nr:moz represents a chromatin-associated acetyltransferase [Emericellopsis cladophorae]KAI6783885.1 moz represents a chromatin-associated acetyltransferase [Emericellopsis cladophorae]